MTLRASYLPPCWDDDHEMRGFMSMLKARHINPVNYDRTIEFWRKVIDDYCQHERKCIFDFEELRSRFRRGNQLPAPLLTVLEELNRSRVVVAADELSSPRQGWLQWGASFIAKNSWMMGNKNDFQKVLLIHLPTLKLKAKEMLEFYRVQYEMIDCPEVVGYDELKNRCSGICDPQSFDLVLDELMRQGEVSEGTSSNGERVLKFKDQTSNRPAKFTQADASVHELRRTMNRIDSETRRLEQRAKKFDVEAREALHRNDRNAAMACLRKKKRLEREIVDKDSQYQRLLGMLEQLATTKQTREIIDAYKTGTQAYKDALNRQGLTAEKVDETMDDINEAIQDANDVEEALREGFRQMPCPASQIDDSALEEELKAILNEEKKVTPIPILELPDVPKDRISFQEDDVAQRLRRLRQGGPLAE